MCRPSLLLLVLAISFRLCWSKPGVQLVSALPSPQMVGTMIGLEARPTLDGDPDKQMRFLQYRFSVSVDGAPFAFSATSTAAPGSSGGLTCTNMRRASK